MSDSTRYNTPRGLRSFPMAEDMSEQDERINRAVWDKLDRKWKREEARAAKLAQQRAQQGGDNDDTRRP